MLIVGVCLPSVCLAVQCWAVDGFWCTRSPDVSNRASCVGNEKRESSLAEAAGSAGLTLCKGQTTLPGIDPSSADCRDDRLGSFGEFVSGWTRQVAASSDCHVPRSSSVHDSAPPKTVAAPGRAGQHVRVKLSLRPDRARPPAQSSALDNGSFWTYRAPTSAACYDGPPANQRSDPGQ